VLKLRSTFLALVVMAALPALAHAQERKTVTGQITDASGQPLAGAVVQIPSLRLNTTTNDRGQFALVNVPLGTHTVRVNLIGYKQVTREVAVDAGATGPINISMATDPLLLDEMVVVGYGEERRRNLAGAQASMKPVTVQETPVASINALMQGQLPGVQVTQNSGTPGAAISVRVRGSSSISGGNQPLYVIDGVPMLSGDFSPIASVSFGGQDVDAVTDLNPAEIEDIQILKDASAAAIYGSRASNGVVLIKTKKGLAGTKPEVTFNAKYGTQSTWRRLQMLNAQQYRDVYNEGCMARYSAPCVTYTDEPLAAGGVPGSVARVTRQVRGADTDWLGEVLRDAPMRNMDASIRGGTDRVRYYVSGSAVDQDGVQKSEGYERLNGRVNLDYDPYTRLHLNTNISLSRAINQRARNDNTIYGAFANAIANPPGQPVFDTSGDYYVTLYSNPVGMNNEAEAFERDIRILGKVGASYDLFAGVVANASVGLDNFSVRGRSWDSPVFLQGPWAGNGGMVEASNTFANKLTYEGTVNFNRLVPGGEVSGVVGTSYEDNTTEFNNTQGTNLPTEYFKYVTSAATTTGSSSRSDWGLTSLFGRLSYTWNDRVTATFNVRRDGSSRFGANNRYGTFPSASILWRAGEESFMKGQGIIGNLALRASYGFTGNQQDLGNFASRGLFGGGSSYNDVPGIAPSQLANPDLRWEKTRQTNIGTDFSILNDRVAFTFDAYDKKTTDLLVQRPVPRTSGFTSIWSNVGSMQNRGVEAQVSARLFQSSSPSGFNWTSTLNLAHNANKVLELYNHQPINAGFGNRVEEGKPLAYFYGYVVEGIFQDPTKICYDATGVSCLANGQHAVQTVNADPRRATAVGDLMFKDLNGDGIINSNDRTQIGNPWPKLEGGFNNTVSLRSFDVSANFQFSYGNDILNDMRVYTDQYGSGGDNHTVRALDRWTPTHTNTMEPRAVYGDPNQNTRTSSRFIEDGSYLRLKDVILGYTLPTSISNRAGFSKARVYLSGHNVFTKTNYTGYDPEVSNFSNPNLGRFQDVTPYPPSRSWFFSVSANF